MINRRQFTFGSLSSLVGVKAFAGATFQRNLKLAVFEDWLPYSDSDDQNTWSGLYVDLALRVTQDIGSQLEFVPNMAWKRLLNDVEFGKLDLLNGLGFNKEREAFIQYIGPDGYDRKFLLLPKSYPLEEINTFQDLSNIVPSISVDEEVVYNRDFNEKLKEDTDFRSKFAIGKILLDDVDPLLQFVKLISSGRFGGVIISEASVLLALKISKDYSMTNEGAEPLKAIPIKAFGEPVTYLGMSRMLPSDIRDKIVKNYKESREDGTFLEIWRRWDSTNSPPPDASPL